MSKSKAAAIESVLKATAAGTLRRGDDFKYHTVRGACVDDALYDAQDRGLLRLLPDGTPWLTEAGRLWLAARPTRPKRASAAPVFAEAADV